MDDFDDFNVEDVLGNAFSMAKNDSSDSENGSPSHDLAAVNEKFNAPLQTPVETPLHAPPVETEPPQSSSSSASANSGWTESDEDLPTAPAVGAPAVAAAHSSEPGRFFPAI